MALRPRQQPLAKDPAGAEGNLRLHDMIARAERIILGVEKGENALFLVVMQELESEKRARDGDAGQQRKLPEPHPGGKKDDPRPGREQQRSAEIGLAQDRKSTRLKSSHVK